MNWKTLLIVIMCCAGPALSLYTDNKEKGYPVTEKKLVVGPDMATKYMLISNTKGGTFVPPQRIELEVNQDVYYSVVLGNVVHGDWDND
jgi:hypothetical protein